MAAGEPIKDEIAQRLALLMGSRKTPQFAALIGIPKSTMDNYVRGKRIPDGVALIRLKEVTGASIDWLLTGDGQMHAPAAPLDVEVLTRVIERVIERRPEASPQEAAQWIAYSYADLMEEKIRLLAAAPADNQEAS